VPFCHLEEELGRSKWVGGVKCCFFPVVTLDLDVPKPLRFKPQPDFPSKMSLSISISWPDIMLISTGEWFTWQFKKVCMCVGNVFV
jgi:hypothetical protein